jgi:hypothetical protein
MSDLKCDNHDGRDAVASVAWPDHLLRPSLTCRPCLDILIDAFVTGDEDHERHAAVIGPIAAEFRTPAPAGSQR